MAFYTGARHDETEPYIESGSSTDESSTEDDEGDDCDVFFEEIDPDFEDTLGAFKTNNPEDNRWQRQFIHTSNERSRFRKTVQTVLVVHGWETKEKKQPMSLIVLSVRLNCHARNFRIQSARMWFAFYEDKKSAPPNIEEANPVVVAFAPFVEQEINNVTPENREIAHSVKGNIGIEKIVNVGLEGSKESKSSYVRQHFDRGTADYLVQNDRVCGINWFCEQNNLTKYYTSLAFLSWYELLIASFPVLLGNKPISFTGIFDMRIEAGSIHDIRDGVRRAFRLNKPEDEAMHYHPSLKTQRGQGWEEFMTNVEEDNLGELKSSEGLIRVLDPQRLLPGLEPMIPSRAT
ncbi:hypothetical protein O1611_g2994 [Lasiodiplodia mahajangana]|uniref:Uncharacterized protein n=1 Tax=Lasiodiplodia mahajangana TaxID=1108764 RepID=A0ACC2JT21_9PEZI|nr:hypothetical protein O1611_g2994 [Lasiodiplodia mahajangana]